MNHFRLAYLGALAVARVHGLPQNVIADLEALRVDALSTGDLVNASEALDAGTLMLGLNRAELFARLFGSRAEIGRA